MPAHVGFDDLLNRLAALDAPPVEAPERGRVGLHPYPARFRGCLNAARLATVVLSTPAAPPPTGSLSSVVGGTAAARPAAPRAIMSLAAFAERRQSRRQRMSQLTQPATASLIILIMRSVGNERLDLLGELVFALGPARVERVAQVAWFPLASSEIMAHNITPLFGRPNLLTAGNKLRRSGPSWSPLVAPTTFRPPAGAVALPGACSETEPTPVLARSRARYAAVR